MRIIQRANIGNISYMAKNNEGKSKKTATKMSSNGKKSGKNSQVSAVVTLVVLVVFVVYYLFSNLSNSPSEQPELPKEITVEKVADLNKITNAERELRPVLQFPYASQVIEHLGYVVSYNADYKVPNWVLYEFTLGETLARLKRSDNFDVDPQVPAKDMAQLEDYRHSGYDRGHMCTSDHLGWSREAQEESFYLSNMCPQDHDFNAGIWLDLEHKIRRWAERDSAITIVCGPVLPRTAAEAKAMKKIGKGHVLVPEQFYKVILAPYAAKPRAIAFLMPNHNETVNVQNRRLREYVVTVDSIEALTGIDFFPALPDKIEKEVEATYNLKDWL